MRNNWLISIILVATLFSFKSSDGVLGTPSASDITGIYWTAEKDAKVKIFLASNGKYSGKTIWMAEPNNSDGSPKTDVNNPNESLRDRTRVGLVALKYFEYDSEDQRWVNGTVYDPRNGKTYDGYMEFDEGNTDKLKLRGYISGMTWLGRTSEWTRVK